MTIVKLFFLALAWCSLGLGTLGIFLPILPTVPLYLLAALLFAKSSERLHRWFTLTNIYKENLESYLTGEGMALKTKCRIALMITLSMSLGAYLTNHIPLLNVILIAIWVALMIYFFVFVKTQTVE